MDATATAAFSLQATASGVTAAAPFAAALSSLSAAAAARISAAASLRLALAFPGRRETWSGRTRRSEGFRNCGRVQEGNRSVGTAKAGHWSAGAEKGVAVRGRQGPGCGLWARTRLEAAVCRELPCVCAVTKSEERDSPSPSSSLTLRARRSSCSSTWASETPAATQRTSAKYNRSAASDATSSGSSASASSCIHGTKARIACSSAAYARARGDRLFPQDKAARGCP